MKQDSQVNLEEWGDISIINKDIVGKFKENRNLLFIDNNSKISKEEIIRKTQTNLIEEHAEVKPKLTQKPLSHDVTLESVKPQFNKLRHLFLNQK